MANNHNLGRNIGNLKGFSTDSIFQRPPNVAEIALNTVLLPDKTTGPRRGYQCQVEEIGGFGSCTYNNPVLEEVETVTIGQDGNLYRKESGKIILYYNGAVTGAIFSITNANPGVVTTTKAHGLISGAMVTLSGVNGMTQVNGQTFTITFISAFSFSIGVSTLLYGIYISGGIFTLYSTASRYLTFSIFTDPAYVNLGGSITCNTIANYAAQAVGTQTGVTTIIVYYGHQLFLGTTVQFLDSIGVFQSRTVTLTTATTITISGTPVTVLNGTYFNLFSSIPFLNGFDVTMPVTLLDFITDLVGGVSPQFIPRLQISFSGTFNPGLNTLPAAFLNLVEPVVIISGSSYTLTYYYWVPVNRTVTATLPGTANRVYQSSSQYEVASVKAFNDVLYVSNGLDFPQKYDGQTVYQAGMPAGQAPILIQEDGTGTIKPFSMSNIYAYGITYSQVDAVGHLVEGVVSFPLVYTVGSTCFLKLTIPDLLAGSGWNTNCAIATGGAATVYGPDKDGNYYDRVSLNTSFVSTLNIGDTAFYNDLKCATSSAATTNSVLIPVNAGHGIEVGDLVTFPVTVPTSEIINGRVTNVTATSITLTEPVTIASGQDITDYKQSPVYGDIGIVNGDQFDVQFGTPVLMKVGHTLKLNDVVDFIDAFGNPQQAIVVFVAGALVGIQGTAANLNYSYLNGTLIVAQSFTAGQISLQRKNSSAAFLAVNDPISNNLRINIYRTENEGTVTEQPSFKRVATIANNSFAATQIFSDFISDAQLGIELNANSALTPAVPDYPPISKYLLPYQNQMIFAGGERNSTLFNDTAFFSLGNRPENCPPATNSFQIPAEDDTITGLGQAGTSLIVTGNNSIATVSGTLATGQFEVISIAPGSNIGCVANATIQSVGSLLYFLHTNGVYAITENQFFPTDVSGNPIPLSRDIDVIFRSQNFLPQTQYIFSQAVAFNYTKDNQYHLFIPCQDPNATQNVANTNSLYLCYDYAGKNWYQWQNINAAGGIFTVGDDLYFHEKRYSGVVGNTFNLYRQHRFYRLIDYADHTQPVNSEWRSSWEDLGQPEVRKKFSHCMLLMDNIGSLDQLNNPVINFSTYLNRIQNLQDTKAVITTVNNVQNAQWSGSPWSWNNWSGYQDNFIRINLRQGTVAKSIQFGIQMTALNSTWRLSGFQFEAIPEFRRTFVR